MTTAQGAGHPFRSRIIDLLGLLHVQLTVAISLPALIGFVCIGFFGNQEVVRSVYAPTLTTAEAVVHVVSLVATGALSTGDIEAVDNLMSHLSESSQGVFQPRYFALYDHRERLVTEANDDGRPPAKYLDFCLGLDKCLLYQYTDPTGKPTLAVSSPVSNGVRWGTVVATFDMTPTSRNMGTLRLRLVGILAICYLAVVLIVNRLVKRLLMDPMQDLTRAALELQRGRLGARAKGKSIRNELSTLIDVFNGMADEMEAYTGTLEARVAERTAEVEQKNRELDQKFMELDAANEALEQIARTDPLTNIYNRRFFFERFQFEIKRGQRAQHDLGILVIDVDYFKRVNDTFGHLVGDGVLVSVARALQRNLRATDVLARFGGEEFVVLLLDAPRESGLAVAEKLRSAVEEVEILGRDGKPVGKVTISIGFVHCEHPEDPDDLLARADDALYQAKKIGRNRVCEGARKSARRDAVPGAPEPAANILGQTRPKVALSDERANEERPREKGADDTPKDSGQQIGGVMHAQIEPGSDDPKGPHDE